MYCRGLHHNISGKVVDRRCFLLKDAIQIAQSVEDDPERRNIELSSFSSPLRNTYVLLESIQGQKKLTSKFNCQEFRHNMSESPLPGQNIPLKRVNLVEKQNLDELSSEMTKKDLEAKEHLAKAANLGIIQKQKLQMTV